MVSCALRLPPAVSGSGVRCGRACRVRISAVPRPSWLGCRGVFFALFFFFFCFVVSVGGCSCPGPCGPCRPFPFLSGWAAGSFLFRGVCLHVSVSLFPVGRCSWLGVAGFGWVVPPCLFGGGVWPPLVVLAGGLVAVGCFSAPPPLPPLLFFFLLFFGGGGCLFLPLPSMGWRTHWSNFSVVFRAAVGGCVLFGRVPAPWVGWAMYKLGSAPLRAGLGPGSAGWAAAPGGCVWLWVRGLGLFVSFPLCGAGFNLLGSQPPLLSGVRSPRVWPAVPVCGVLVRRLLGCAMACFG